MNQLNHGQINKVALFLKNSDIHMTPLNFYSFRIGDKEQYVDDMYPPLNHPQTIDFFFFVALHQYGFWESDNRGYVKPIIGTFNGKPTKGSDLLFKTANRAFAVDPNVFSPSRLAELSHPDELSLLLSDDFSDPPYIDPFVRYGLTLKYATWLTSHHSSPSIIVQTANLADLKLHAFRFLLKSIPGFDHDQLEKKNLLLAMIMANRPEHFLTVNDPEHWDPIVDYHLMRISLRLGLVIFFDYHQLEINRKRLWVSDITEFNIRSNVHEAIRQLIKISDLPMSSLDHLLWQARKYCPEMTQPDCDSCFFNSVCAKKQNFFSLFSAPLTTKLIFGTV